MSIVSICISAASLAVAITSLVISYRFKKHDRERADELAEVQLALQRLQLKSAEAEDAKRRESRVEARHVALGANRHVLRVANVSHMPVTDITVTYDKQNGPILMQEELEPFERLEPQQHFDETMVLYMGVPQKFPVVVHWKDQEGNQLSREYLIAW